MPNYNLYVRTSSGLLVRPDDRRQVYPNPSATEQMTRHATYEQMFAYYSNTAFDEVATWARYRQRYNLYRYTRPIFNPVTRVVDFYAEHIYPGVLSTEPILDGGVQSAMPFAYETPEELRQAAFQVWQWSNWQINKDIMVQNGALAGNVLVEIKDDLERGKVRYQVFYPTFVKDFRLDEYGNLTAYVLEYPVSDARIDNGRTFTYAKEVQKDFIAYYKNGQPHDYGNGEVIANPYGFVPAVWAKHRDIGTDHGVPAMRSSIAKIDELNSMVSHTADHIHKRIESPRILWSNDKIKPLFGSETLDSTDFDSRQQQVLLKGTSGGSTDTLVGDLDPQTIIPMIEKFTEEIEKDYPEITLYEKLRDQNIVTAPGAARLMGDVAKKISMPAANYDSANVKLVQMSLAIGGYRANNGDWGEVLTPQQKKFLPFDLESYNKGELDFGFTPRALTSPTSREEADELTVRASAVSVLEKVLPLEERLKLLGKRPEEIPGIVAKVKAEQEEAMQQQVALAQATKPEPKPTGGE